MEFHTFCYFLINFIFEFFNLFVRSTMESRNVEENPERGQGGTLFFMRRKSSVCKSICSQWVIEHAVVEERRGQDEVNESSRGRCRVCVW